MSQKKDGAAAKADSQARAAADKETKGKSGEVDLEALEPILHDGEPVAPGDPFTVTAKQARTLLARNRAKKA